MFLIEVEFNDFAQIINIFKITPSALGINGVMGVITRLVTLPMNTKNKQRNIEIDRYAWFWFWLD